MPESGSNPARVTIRKVAPKDGDNHVYIYLRTNVSQKEVTDENGETQILYEYDEQHLAVPLPDIGIDLPGARDPHATQYALKAALREAFLGSGGRRAMLKAQLPAAEAVDRLDNLQAFEDDPLVDIEPEHSWAEALCIALAPLDVSGLKTEIVGEYKKLVRVGDYNLWRANAPVETLVSLHEELWAMAPTETLGILAAVGKLGESFLPWAVVNNTTMTQREAAARRDRIATYLEGLGYEDTQDLKAASDEHELIAGIATALGYAMSQVWAAME